MKATKQVWNPEKTPIERKRRIAGPAKVQHCGRCGVEYLAFRVTSRYCTNCYPSKVKASAQRDRVLASQDGRCRSCGLEGAVVRVRPGVERIGATDSDLVGLCSKCNSKQSRQMFYASGKWEPGRPGYVAYVLRTKQQGGPRDYPLDVNEDYGCTRSVLATVRYDSLTDGAGWGLQIERLDEDEDSIEALMAH